MNQSGRFFGYYDLQKALCMEELQVTDKTVLEVGCGNGYLIQRLSRGPWNLIGLEASRKAIERAKSRLGALKNVHLVLGSAEFLPFRQGAFGFVVSFEVIEHLDYPERAVNEISRCMKPGARLLLTTPNMYGLRNFVVRLTRRLRMDNVLFPADLLHKHILEPRQLYARATFSGLTVTCLYPVQLGIIIPRLYALLHTPSSRFSTSLLLRAVKGQSPPTDMQ